MRRAVLLSLFCLAGLTACSEPEAGENPPWLIAWALAEDAGPPPARPASGEVRAVRDASVAFEVSGRIAEISAFVGDRVEAGGTLARLDDSRHRQEVLARRGDLDAARSALQEKQRMHDRAQALAPGGAVSQAELDAARAAHGVAEGQVQAAAAALAAAELDLRDTALAAPFSGRVAARHVSEGMRVQAGTAAFRLVSDDTMEAVVWMPESLLLDLDPDADHTVGFPRLGETVAARIAGMSAASGESGVFEVILALDRVPSRARPGMAVDVLMTRRRDAGQAFPPGASRVPASALIPGEGGRHTLYVVKADGETLEERQVQLLDLAGEEAIVSGVAQGEIVVARGAARLADGDTVALMGVGPLRFNP